MSFGWIVTRPAWIAQTFTSSNIVTRNDSEASWRARMAVLWKRREGSMFWATSLTKRWKGSFLINRSVDFWYFRISRRSTPGTEPTWFTGTSSRWKCHFTSVYSPVPSTWSFPTRTSPGGLFCPSHDHLQRCCLSFFCWFESPGK